MSCRLFAPPTEPYDDPEPSEPDPFLQRPNVIAVKPWRLNQRMIIQQGWFLVPTSLDTTFEHNLMAGLGLSETSLPRKSPARNAGEIQHLLRRPDSNVALLKLVFPRRMHLDAMRDLHRMNITATSLFPGLDGFARSLRYSLRIFDWMTEEER